MAASTILYHMLEERDQAARHDVTRRSGIAAESAAESAAEIKRLKSELSEAQSQIRGLVEACRDARLAMIDFSNLLDWPDWTPAAYYTALNQLGAWIDYVEGKETDLCVNEYLGPLADHR